MDEEDAQNSHDRGRAMCIVSVFGLAALELVGDGLDMIQHI